MRKRLGWVRRRLVTRWLRLVRWCHCVTNRHSPVDGTFSLWCATCGREWPRPRPCVSYSVWSSADGGSLTMCVDDVPNGPLRPDLSEPGMRRVKTFEADSWDVAMALYHEWMGWEPYKPMPDAKDSP